jgi:large conductance mechanosensitive channel
MSTPGLWQQFKGFALKGNMINLAVAVVIGNAFGAVVNSLVKNVIMPMLSYVMPSEKGYRDWHIGRVEIGAFLGELLNFIVIASAMFLIMVKTLDILRRAGVLPATSPQDKTCPFCLSTIPLKAKKCAHCTADLPAEG